MPTKKQHPGCCQRLTAPGVLFLFFLFLLAGFGLFFTGIRAQTPPDAIAIRIIPNPEHYSAQRWYQKQGFNGSPQSLTVDGYEAVRDGRTVYVNAANIDDNGTPADPSDDLLYTNIYLISYNQKAEKPTIDIFAQILTHWRFNTNVIAPGACSQTADTQCRLDSDCPAGEYCLSQKAKIIRDTRRLADLADIKDSLSEYEQQNNAVPQLLSGSYLPRRTLSVWPSWQNLLAQYLSRPLPIDPVNKLGPCGDSRFNPITCWDENAKEFSGAIPTGLPAGSRVYAYRAQADHSYTLCAQIETNYSNILFASCLTNPDCICGNGSQECGEECDDGNNINGDGCSADCKVESPPACTDADKDTYDICNPGDSGDDGKPADCEDQPAGADGISGNADDGANIHPDAVEICDGLDNNCDGSIDEGWNEESCGFICVSLNPSYNYNSARSGDLRCCGDDTNENAPPTAGFTYQPQENSPLDLCSDGDDNDCDGLVDGLDTDCNSCIPDCSCAASLCVGESCLDPHCGTVCNGAITSDCSCANSICVGSTCPDRCSGGVCSGTLTPDCSCAASLCVGESCLDPHCGTECAGTVDCCPSVTLDPLNNATRYALPAGATPPLYYWPTLYDEYANITDSQAVTYSLSSGPSWLVINPVSGEIQGTQTANSNNVYSVGVTATNGCGKSDTVFFTLTVLPNAWCGDGTVQSGFGELCDTTGGGGTSASDQYACDSSCSWTGGWCGDGTVQSGFGELCDTTGGGGTSASDQYACDSSCQWSGGWCGDGVCSPVYNENVVPQCIDCCIPETCASLGVACGTHLDGCGGTIDCGNNCPSLLANSVCDAGVCKVSCNCIDITPHTHCSIGPETIGIKVYARAEYRNGLYYTIIDRCGECGASCTTGWNQPHSYCKWALGNIYCDADIVGNQLYAQAVNALYGPITGSCTCWGN